MTQAIAPQRSNQLDTSGNWHDAAFHDSLLLNREDRYAGAAGYVEDRLKELSAEGDPLERLTQTLNFEVFRPALVEALGRSDPSKGGRPGFNPVLKFKMLVLGAMHGLSLQQTDYLVRDRLSWMRFCGAALATPFRTLIRCGISGRP